MTSDRSGKLWDTNVTKIIYNPISICAAFFLPYVRVARFVADQMEKWASSRDQDIQKRLESGVQNTATEAGSPDHPKKPGPLGGNAIGVAGMIAAAGIALGAIGAGLASLFTTMKALTWWEFPLVLIGLILLF